ncbi:MAG: FG-GAP repeat protein [Candidatus Electrothrix scaldis]|nr:MAG: FG-GAP repeat protein [Candidatus Electrothrix sp. GW3-3]
MHIIRIQKICIGLFLVSLFINSSIMAEIDTTKVQKLLGDAGDASDWFGVSVSVYDNTALVGTWPGAVYVFTRNTQGAWTQQEKLTLPPEEGDKLGSSVSLYGNTALIGSHFDVEGSYIRHRAAYVFVRDSGGNWSQQAKLSIDDYAEGDWFGVSVSLSGDTAAIGAMGDDGTGAVYIFTRNSDGVWSQQAKLTSTNSADFDLFGIAVSLYQDTVLIGARQNGVDGLEWAGSAYVFTRSGVTWTQQQKLTPSDEIKWGYFGNAVSVYGDTALIGARRDQGLFTPGAAYIFVRDISGHWSEAQKLMASDAALQDHDNFGGAVSVYGNTALIGASQSQENSIMTGATYVFQRDNSGNWTQQKKIVAFDAAANDRFGYSVSLSKNNALTGAIEDNSTGSAYCYGSKETGNFPILYLPAILRRIHP